MDPYKFRGVGHTGITVSDLDRALRVFRDILGCESSPVVNCSGELFERVTGIPGAVIDVAFVKANGHVLELLCYRQPQERSASRLRACDAGFLHICLKVRNIEQIVRALEVEGFKTLSPIQLIDAGPAAGMKAVYTRDGDGLTLELVEEPDGVVLEELYG